MKRLGFLLLLTVLLLGGRAQAQRITNYGRQIELVHSVAGAQRLLDTLCGPDCDLRIELDSLQEELVEKCALCSVDTPPSWVRADLDGDGRLDLLLSSSDGSRAVLNRPSARPQVGRVSLRGHHHWCRVVAVGRKGGRPVIQGEDIEYISRTRKEQGQRPRRWHFVLMYQLGTFVDYAARPRWLLPHRIRLQHYSGGVYGSGGLIELNLKTGQATGWGHSRTDSIYRKDMCCQVSPGLLDTLRQHLRYLRLSALQRRYDKNANDAGNETLTLHYRFRWPKQVADYGRMAPHSVQVINDLLLAVYERELKRPSAEPAQRH